MTGYIPREIDVRNMDAATAQEVFDWVVYCLLLQNCVSMPEDGKGKCLYRGADGTKCAAGHLIPDELYYPRLERCMWYELVDTPGGFTPKHCNLVYDLQTIHDRSIALEWPVHYAELAYRYGLEYRFDGFTPGIGWPHRTIDWAAKLDFLSIETDAEGEPHWRDSNNAMWRVWKNRLQCIAADSTDSDDVIDGGPCPDTEQEFIALVQRMRMQADY